MSLVIEKIAGELGIPLRSQGALRLIRRCDCDNFVEACKSAKLLILGIEAFRIIQGRPIPDTDFIADFSDLASEPWELAYVEAARSAAIYFGKASAHADLWFDFSLREVP